jgi:hypothetical protein
MSANTEYINQLKKLYNLKLVTLDILKDMVTHNIISINDYEYITGTPFYK